MKGVKHRSLGYLLSVALSPTFVDRFPPWRVTRYWRMALLMHRCSPKPAHATEFVEPTAEGVEPVKSRLSLVIVCLGILAVLSSAACAWTWNWTWLYKPKPPTTGTGGGTTPPPPTTTSGKKIIEYGWDVTTPTYVAQNIRSMETKPFDGIMMKLQSNGLQSVLTRTRWSETTLQPQFDALQQIQWSKFTDNFMITYASSNQDWFNDSDWASIEYNVGLLAKATKLGRCKGLVFDPEPYGSNPWTYSAQPQAGSHSFAEYKAKVRQRGAQFMRAYQAQFPSGDVYVLSFYMMKLFKDCYINPNNGDSALVNFEWGLLPSFINGMLDAANSNVVLLDGNEGSYYYTTGQEFTDARNQIRQTCADFVAPELKTKYLNQVRNAPALYPDYIYDLLGTSFWKPLYCKQLSASERNLWMEHNVYSALQTSDKYVWLYCEHMNWWTNTGIPSGLANAITSAKTKIDNNQPLGFDITTFMNRAKANTPR